MNLIKFQMGCLSSRSTVAPENELEQETSGTKVAIANGKSPKLSETETIQVRQGGAARTKSAADIDQETERSFGRRLADSLDRQDEDLFSILMNDDEDEDRSRGKRKDYNFQPNGSKLDDNLAKIDDNKAQGDLSVKDGKTAKSEGDEVNNSIASDIAMTEVKRLRQSEGLEREASLDVSEQDGNERFALAERKLGRDEEEDESSDELNLDLLRQYIAVDYEIQQLESRNALRVYHEKIEQLEQLEHELDMISSEAEQMIGSGGISESELQLLTEAGLASPSLVGTNSKPNHDPETNSSAASGSVTPNSWERTNGNGKQLDNRANSRSRSRRDINPSKTNGVAIVELSSSALNGPDSEVNARQVALANRGARADDRIKGQSFVESPLAIEKIFNKKIVLERERDKLKKEVEIVIVECDKLQQKCERRDDILDQLFDGRSGNGLENHLEQQLSWLLEQKHYVDQVFYAWKRAETLTIQTCEQFARALELLKRLSKTPKSDKAQRAELSENIISLLIESRRDMEQAQRYNPNVDALFFTDGETKHFDKIIETIQSDSISSSGYSQIQTVIQFAYKRAVGIRFWLEQILETTIARDSFELAEEYKWIAIQLRKERINLIKSRLQEEPYMTMAQEVIEEIVRQQQQQQQHHQPTLSNSRMRPALQNGQQLLALTDGNKSNGFRDSGNESEVTEALEIEEQIHRLIKLKEAQGETGGLKSGSQRVSSPLKPINEVRPDGHELEMDDAMRNRIERRQANGSAKQALDQTLRNNHYDARSVTSKLKIDLDETTKRQMLEEVNRMHTRHKKRLDALRSARTEQSASSNSKSTAEVRRAVHRVK